LFSSIIVISFDRELNASLGDADTTTSRKWARRVRPVRDSAGVDIEVDVESERRDATRSGEKRPDDQGAGR
jgi:hypothetical protein